MTSRHISAALLIAIVANAAALYCISEAYSSMRTRIAELAHEKAARFEFFVAPDVMAGGPYLTFNTLRLCGDGFEFYRRNLRWPLACTKRA